MVCAPFGPLLCNLISSTKHADSSSGIYQWCGWLPFLLLLSPPINFGVLVFSAFTSTSCIYLPGSLSLLSSWMNELPLPPRASPLYLHILYTQGIVLSLVGCTFVSSRSMNMQTQAPALVNYLTTYWLPCLLLLFAFIDFVCVCWYFRSHLSPWLLGSLSSS